MNLTLLTDAMISEKKLFPAGSSSSMNTDDDIDDDNDDDDDMMMCILERGRELDR